MKLKTIIGLAAMATFGSLLLLSFGEQVGGYMNFTQAEASGNKAHVVGTWADDQPMHYDRADNVFTFHMRDETGAEARFQTKLLGQHNVLNLLLAVAVAVGALMIALALLLWARRQLASNARYIGTAAIGILAVLAFVVPLKIESAVPDAGGTPAAADWAAFDRTAIARHVAAGHTVFVDVTADWCLTCQANKLMVLDRDPVAARLAGDGVIAMRADWTRPDETITAYLAEFGRYGIPFNVVYGPAAPDGLPLPELLTDNAVLDALDRAGQGGLAARMPMADRAPPGG